MSGRDVVTEGDSPTPTSESCSCSCASSVAGLREALQGISDEAMRQYTEWIHFHELAMADPFKAESQAQEFTMTVRAMAVKAGADPRVFPAASAGGEDER